MMARNACVVAVFRVPSLCAFAQEVSRRERQSSAAGDRAREYGDHGEELQHWRYGCRGIWQGRAQSDGNVIPRRDPAECSVCANRGSVLRGRGEGEKEEVEGHSLTSARPNE